MQDTSLIKSNFFKSLKFLEGVSTFVGKIDRVYTNRDLLLAATRLTVPKIFTPFVRIMKQSLKDLGLSSKFNLDSSEVYSFSTDEVRASDESAAARFSIPSFTFKGINLNYLFRASLITWSELGFDTYEFQYTELQDCVTHYKQSTSSGFPTFKKKGSEIAITDAYSWNQNFLERPSIYAVLLQPTAVFHRFQLRIGPTGELVKKIRQVWALPYRVLTLQYYVFGKLLDHCTSFTATNRNLATSWGLKGNPEISRTIVKRFKFIQSFHKCKIVSLDVESFDSNIPSWMFALFLGLLRTVIPRELHKVLECLIAYECFTPYVLGTGKLKFQMRGIPSGSLLTQLFGTFVTRTVINYAFLEYSKGRRAAGEFSNCLGDDNLVALVGITYSHLLSVYRRFELPINVSKTKLTGPGQNFSYLGPTWDSESRPVQPLEWYIARFACPSRYVVQPPFTIDKFQTYRCISVATPNFMGLETFEKLIGNYDRVYQEMLADLALDKEVSVPILDSDRQTIKQVIPLERLKRLGWLAFSDSEMVDFDFDFEEIPA